MSSSAGGAADCCSWDCQLQEPRSLQQRPFRLPQLCLRQQYFVLVVLLFSLRLSFFPVLGSSLNSVPDIESAMYENIAGTPCVRLLSLTGEIGCANPGRGKIHAPMLRFTNSTITLSAKTTVVLSSSVLHEFLDRTVSDPLLAVQVAAVLVEFTNETSRTSNGLSPDTTFPQSEFAPYEGSYVWNTVGSGILTKKFDFPVFLLSEESTASVLKVSAENEMRNFKYPLHVAEFDSIMQTTKSGTHNSESCLEEWSCLPLGGYSVWSSLSPIDLSVPSERPILLVVASMDSASFFRDVSTGADSSLSGMIAVLAAVDALSKVADIGQFQKQVVFLLVTGEAWGYLGSRRFLAELAAGDPSVAGLSADRIDQILEVGSVGQALTAGNVTLFAHKAGSQISAKTQEILDSLQKAASSLDGDKDFCNVEVKLANERIPGIPPSSMMSFLQQNRTTAGVVLEEFDEAFKNLFYHSHLDLAGNVYTTAVTCTASIIARATYLLGNNVNLTSLESIVVNASLVEEMVQCLLSRSPPGMNCSLVTDLITPIQQYANHYVGVLIGSPSATPYVESIDDTARFIWNFLASRTGMPRAGPSEQSGSKKESASEPPVEECTTTCSREDEVCVASTGQHKGYCLQSTTRYVPAYSPRLRYDSYGWKVIAAAPGDVMSEVDPVWTESYWKSLTVRLFLQESSRHDVVVLTWGLAVTLGSFLAVALSRVVLCKRLKRD